MIDDDVIERVYQALTKKPQSTRELAPFLNMDRHKLAFVLATLKRMGKAERIDKALQVGRGLYGSRSFWVKT